MFPVFFVIVVLVLMAMGFMYVLGGPPLRHTAMPPPRESFSSDPEGYLNIREGINSSSGSTDMFEPSPAAFNSANMADVEIGRLSDPVSFGAMAGTDYDSSTFFSDDELYRYGDDT